MKQKIRVLKYGQGAFPKNSNKLLISIKITKNFISLILPLPMATFFMDLREQGKHYLQTFLQRN